MLGQVLGLDWLKRAGADVQCDLAALHSGGVKRSEQRLVKVQRRCWGCDGT